MNMILNLTGKKVTLDDKTIVKAMRYFNKEDIKGYKSTKLELVLDCSWVTCSFRKGKDRKYIILHLNEVLAYCLGYRKIPKKAIVL